MKEKIIKKYRCPECESSSLKEIFEGMAPIKVIKFWKDGKKIKEECSYDRLKSTNIICEKCDKKYIFYNELLSELDNKYIEKQLIDWLKEYFSKNLLDDFDKKNVDKKELDKKNEPMGERFLEIYVPYFNHYKEFWLLNKDDKNGNNIQLSPYKSETIKEGMNISIKLYKEKDESTWKFDCEHIASFNFRSLGYGYEGKIIFNEKSKKFIFDSVILNKFSD